MMQKIFYAVLGTTALTVASVVGSTALSSAQAQKKGSAPIILVVNQAQLMAQSKAGKSANEQIETIRTSVAGELNAEKEKLEADIQNYQKNKDLWSPDQRQKEEQKLAFRTQQQLPQMGQIMEAAFVQTVRKTENDILKEAQPIMQNIVDKRKATLLLERQTVMYVAEEVNITQEVINALDKKMKTVTVENVSLAEIRRRAEEAARQQQQQQ